MKSTVHPLFNSSKNKQFVSRNSKVMAPNKVTFNISIVSILLKAVTSRVIANVCCWLMIRLIKLDDVNWMLQPLEGDHNSNRQEIKCHMADLQCVAVAVKIPVWRILINMYRGITNESLSLLIELFLIIYS